MGQEFDRGSVEAMLQRVGRALSEGHPEQIPPCWQLPAFVVSDDGARCISAAEEIENFFRQAITWYHNQGLMATRPTLLALQQLSPRIASVDVRWIGLDAQGREKTNETSRYVLHRGDDGQPRIQVAMSLSAA